MKTTDEKIQIKIITENVNTREFELPFYAEIKENLIAMDTNGRFECYYNGTNRYRSIVVKEEMTMENFIHEIDFIVNKGVKEIEFKQIDFSFFKTKRLIFMEEIGLKLQ